MDRQTSLDEHFKRNRQMLDVFRKKQVDLAERRAIELHFWAWGQPSSVRLANELCKQGFVLLMLKPAQRQDDSEVWNIEAETTASIQDVVAERFTARLTDLAARFDAVYDGWGTSI